jgi:hypothetical protein
MLSAGNDMAWKHIDFQMGQARWAGPKSTTRARPGTESILPRAGPARLSDRVWAATSAQQPSTGTTRKYPKPDAARLPPTPPPPAVGSGHPRLLDPTVGDRVYKPSSHPWLTLAIFPFLPSQPRPRVSSSPTRAPHLGASSPSLA